MERKQKKKKKIGWGRNQSKWSRVGKRLGRGATTVQTPVADMGRGKPCLLIPWDGRGGGGNEGDPQEYCRQVPKILRGRRKKESTAGRKGQKSSPRLKRGGLAEVKKFR